MLTTVETLPNPIPLLADEFPRSLLSHEGRNTAEGDLCPVRVALDAYGPVDLRPVAVDQRTLNPCGKRSISHVGSSVNWSPDWPLAKVVGPIDSILSYWINQEEMMCETYYQKVKFYIDIGLSF